MRRCYIITIGVKGNTTSKYIKWKGRVIMKKFYILWPTILAYFIVTLSAFILPGSRTHYGEFLGQYAYGYPLTFINMFKDYTLTFNRALIGDCMRIDIVSLVLNIVVLMLVINLSIVLFRIIFLRKRGVQRKNIDINSDENRSQTK